MTKPNYPGFAGTERELLENHLEHNRNAVRHKVEGLSLELGIKRLADSPTSVLGIVKHLTEVEGWWFRYNFDGEDWVGSSSEENPDGEFDILPSESVTSLLLEYDLACEKSREICAKHSLEDLAQRQNRNGLTPSLRWIYLHMIEEIARHNGHLDIYRELLDGTTDRS